MAATVAASTTPANAGTCGQYGGWGIGVTLGVAMIMSTKAMHQALDHGNAKQTGCGLTKRNTNFVMLVQCHTMTTGCAN